MNGVKRRIVALATVGIVAVPLTVVAAAFGCANLASVKLNAASARSGQQVSFVGRNFNTSPAASAVQVRWNSRRGPVLYEGRPANNKLKGTFTVPDVAAGHYVIVATQTGPNGRIASGTPGRAPIRVKASSSSGAVVAPASPGNGPAGYAPVAIAGLLSLTLLGGLGTMLARRRSSVPAL